ncbi:acyltransferase family protein [Flavitalea flava]
MNDLQTLNDQHSRASLADSLKKGFARAFNTAILEKNRMAWVDYLRGIAIVLVVYRHVLLGLQRGNMVIPTSLINANMIFFSFRMPLFFILSGIFIGGSIARRPLNKLIFTKFENLLYPYLIWAFIQVTLQICLARFANSDRTVMDYTLILYQPRGLDQFWYLPALFNATLVYLLLKVKLKVPNWGQLLLGIGLYFLAPFCTKISMMSDWMEFFVFFALGDCISVIFFKAKSQALLNSPLTLLVMIPVFTVTQVFYLAEAATLKGVGQLEFLAIALIGCFAMFVLAFRLQTWNILRFLRVLGFHSLFIYVMHVMVAAFVRSLLMKVFGLHNPVILLACGIFAGVTIPVIFYNLLIKDNVLWFLFYVRKPQKKVIISA